VLSAGVIDSLPAVGILMPSVDKVGRYFPLIVLRPLPATACLCQELIGNRVWFERVEALALYALQQDVSADQLLALLLEQERLAGDKDGLDAAVKPYHPDWSRPVVLTMSQPDQGPIEGFPFLLDSFLQQRFASYSLWWTGGSQQMGASLLVSSYLPAPRQFAAMLNGQWQDWGFNPPLNLLSTPNEESIG
jgi:type VI secretion system protein ImpM